MTIQDFKNSFFDFCRQFFQVKSGVVGLALMIIFLLIVIFEPLLVTFDEAGTRWNDITYWSDSPKSAAPAWSNLFAAEKGAVTATLPPANVTEGEQNGFPEKTYTFDYDFTYDRPPSNLIVRFSGEGETPYSLAVSRPDGHRIELINGSASLQAGGESGRIDIERATGAAVAQFVAEASDGFVRLNQGMVESVLMLFSQANREMYDTPTALRGLYTFQLTLTQKNDQVKFGAAELFVSGTVSGLLGTDNFKRDLFSGVIIGVKWALLIGLLVSTISVFIGVMYGVIAAYLGGKTYTVMMRIFEIFINTPLLPVLIAMSAVFKPSLATLIFMMCFFFWVSPVKTVTSMAMQIKEETFIEASVALGAGKFRIISRHIVPLLLPYSFSIMALNVPSAIIYEATISLLGLGDPTIVTWGQILHSALTGGAVLNGIWWWVIPPGLMIAAMGMTFAFLGFSLDKILHPKLRTR